MYEIWPKWEESHVGRPRPGRSSFTHDILGSTLVRVLMCANAIQSNVVSYKMHKQIAKDVNHAEARLKTESQTDLRRNIQALSDMSVQQTAENR